MVFNVTKEDVRVRMAVIDEDIWPQPPTQQKIPAELDKRIGFSKEIIGGRVAYPDVVKEMFDEVNEQYGTKVPLPK
jgi:ribonuclease Z